MTPAIRPVADAAEIAAVSALIAHSFDHLEANHYLVPKQDERLERMTGFFALLTEHAAEHGKVLVTEDGSAGAVWFDRTRDPVEPVEYERRLKAAVGDFVDRFDALDELFEKHHPAEPHWHLAFLAVHPDRWGQGLGSALMNHTHAELEADGHAAYLESTNADNHRLYRRHGYVDMTPFEINLPDGTPFYRMWRPAGA